MMATVRSLAYVEPAEANTGAWRDGKIPVLDCVMPDGRELYVSFEMPYDRARRAIDQINDMRNLAATLVAEASRLATELAAEPEG